VINPLSLDQLTVLGATPIELVSLAAANGCGRVGIYLQSWNAMPAYNLCERTEADALLRCCRENHVLIAVAEPFLLMPDTRPDALLPNLEAAARLQVEAINAVAFDTDPARLTNTFGALCDRAAEFDMDTFVEFFPLSAVKTLGMAAQLIRDVGRRGVRINLDVLHLMRSGGTAAEVKALDPDLIGHVQISDGPLRITPDRIMTEATEERGLPGQGEFPLRDILAALPEQVPIGVEVPSLSRLRAGVTSAEWASVAVNATRATLASCHRHTAGPREQ
jgi:sugar phosphate isomerase/epimerase